MTSYTSREKCSLCRSSQLDVCARLPPTPIANELPSRTAIEKEDELFPLELLMCRACRHVQLSCIVDPTRLFSEYLYETSTSPQTTAHLRREAEALVLELSKVKWKESPSVLEIGSNDGSFLKELMAMGFPHQNLLGIEPSTTMSKKATAAGVPTLRAFFGPDVVRVLHGGRKWSAIAANNVLAHVPSVVDVLETMAEYLADDGVFLIEVGGAADIFRGAFDVIYHEHTSYHSLGPLRRALEEVKVPMFDVERIGQEVGRGSLRVWAGRRRSPSTRMMDALLEEEKLQLDDAQSWMKILGKGKYSALAMVERQIWSFFGDQKLKKENPVVLGYGAPAKMTTLTYACHVPNVDAVIEDSPWKIGRATPGKKISIVSLAEGLAMKPDAIVAFAWNFAEPIAKKLQEAGWRGPLFVPLPKARTIDVGEQK